MEKIALIVTIEYQPESKAVFLQALFSHKQRCSRTEPGMLQFDVLHPTDGANAVVLFELYANQAALDLHDAGPSLALFKEQAGPFITKASAQHCAMQEQD